MDNHSTLTGNARHDSRLDSACVTWRSNKTQLTLAAAALLVTACGGGGGGTAAEPIAPQALEAVPASGAVDVELDVAPRVLFDTELDATTVSSDSVRLDGPTGRVSGQAAYFEDSMAVQFTPNDPLEPNARYELTLSASILGSNGAAIAANTRVFDTVRTPAQVVGTNPEEGDLGVALDANLSVSFDQPLDASTIDGSTVAVTDASGMSIDGDVSYAAVAQAVVFDPTNDLAPGLGYILTLGDDILGANELPLDSFTLTFACEGVAPSAPKLVTSVPGPGGTLGEGSNPSATFDMPLDPTTVSFASVQVQSQSGSQGGQVLLDLGNRRITFIPNPALEPSTNYTFTLTSAILGSNGLPFAGATISFNTEEDAPAPQVVSTSPSQNATVRLDISLFVSFDSNLKMNTVNSGSVQLRDPNGTNVAGTVDMADARTVRFDPVSDLDPESGYELRLSSNLTGENDTPIEPFSLNFQTGARPVIESISPELSAPVERNAMLQVVFNTDMNQQSVQNGITLLDAGQPIAAQVTLLSDNRTATIEPDEDFDMLALCELRIASSARSTLDIPLGQQVTHEFTTVDGEWANFTATISQSVSETDVDPAIAMSIDGTATAVFRSTNWGIAGARYEPSAPLPWQQEEEVDDHFDISGLSVVTDDQGRAIAVWRFQDEIRYNRYDNGWSPASEVISLNNTDVGDPMIAMTPQGAAIVAWTQQDYSVSGPNHNIAYRVFQSTGNLGLVQNVLSANQSLPILELALGMDAAGRTAVAFTMFVGDRYQVHATQAQSFNASFDGAFPIDNPNSTQGDAVDVAIAVENGIALATWIQDTFDGSQWRNRLWLNRLEIVSSTWDANPALVDDNSAGSSSKPSIALSKDAEVGMVIWRQEFQGQARDRFGAHRINATNSLADALTTPVLLETDPFDWAPDVDPLDLQLGLDGRGNGIAVYRLERDAGGYDVVARRYVESQDSWSEAERIEQKLASAFAPQISVTADGRATAIWYAAATSQSSAQLLANRFE